MSKILVHEEEVEERREQRSHPKVHSSPPLSGLPSMPESFTSRKEQILGAKFITLVSGRDPPAASQMC